MLVLDWWPDASALLLRHEHEGRHRLYRLRPRRRHAARRSSTPKARSAAGVSGPTAGSGCATPRARPPLGSSTTPAPRCWLPRASARPRAARTSRGASRTSTGSPCTASTSRPRARARGPFLMHPHGGPTWLDEDRWSPEVQAYVDAGFAVGLVNYRGSTGFGAEWRDTLIGDIGGPEIEDLNAALADLVANGDRRSRARGDRRLVVGRLPHADGARHAPRALARRARRRARRRLRHELRRHVARSCRRTTAPCWAARRPRCRS